MFAYHHYMHERGTRLNLRNQAELAERQRDWLRAYPEVRVEPLDFLYGYIRLLALKRGGHFAQYDENLDWRRAILVALALALDPDPAYLPLMRSLWENCPHNRFVIGLAIDRIEGQPSPGKEEPFAHAKFLGEVLGDLQWPHLPARPDFTHAERMDFERDKALLRTIYKTQGLEGAKRFFQGSILAYIDGSYDWWRYERLALPFYTDRKVGGS